MKKIAIARLLICVCILPWLMQEPCYEVLANILNSLRRLGARGIDDITGPPQLKWGSGDGALLGPKRAAAEDETGLWRISLDLDPERAMFRIPMPICGIALLIIERIITA
jgi:hypothetical protein